MTVRDEPIVVFLHVATLGRYQQVLDETFAALTRSPLFPLLQLVSINVVGEGDVVVSTADSHTVINRWSANVNHFEHPTLAAMRHYAQQNPGARVLYLNCLGGRYQGRAYANRSEWRRMLHLLLLDNVQQCLEALTKFDICGVDWSLLPFPHMTSNNWWARADYLRRLPAPEACVQSVLDSDLSRFGPQWSNVESKRRHAAEFWLGMGHDVRPLSLFPLRETGLPLSEYGSVPWWYLEGVPWETLARERSAGGGSGARVSRYRYRAVPVFKYRCRKLKERASNWVRGISS